MATVLDRINRALRLLGVKASGEEATQEEANDAFEALNSMIDSWNNESLMIYNLETVSHTLVPGTGDYTIGTGGTINTTRPQRIESAYINDNNSDWPIAIIKNEEYSRIWQKTTQASYPSYLYYQSDFPLGTIKLWPVPSSANTLNLNVWNQIAAFASTASTVSLPPGYTRMMDYNLAVELAPEYLVEPSMTIQKIANDSKSRIKIVNSKNAPTLRSPMRNLGSGGSGDVNIRSYFNA